MQPAPSPSNDSKKPSSSSSHPFNIERIPIDNPEYMNEVPEHLRNKHIPGFPSTIVAIGRPGSGKTNVLMNLLTRKEFWYKFFDKIYLMGPTIKSDKLFKKIKVPQDQQVSDPEEFLTKLEEWTTEQVQKVEHDAKNAPKCLFLFEDITAYRMSIQNDPRFIKGFTTIRHHKATAYANIHKFSALERTARLNCMHVLCWPVNKTDIECLYEDYGTSNLDKKDFNFMCEYAWTPDDKNEKPFLYINMYAPQKERFRKCFTDIIRQEMFQGMHKKKQAELKEKLGLSGSRKRKKGDDEPQFVSPPPPPPKRSEESNKEKGEKDAFHMDVNQDTLHIPSTRLATDSVLAFLH